MDVKRMLTLIFGLVLVSYLAMKLVWYMNPPSRPHYNNFFAYDYSTVNYVQFIILFLIPSIASLFLYRSSFKKIDSFYDQSLERVKKAFFILEKNKETVLVVGIVVFWIFNLMEHGFFRNLVEDKNPFHSPFDTYHEGEKVAFLYTFLGNNEALKHMFIIHGYFLEVLTSYFAYLIAPENHSLMGFRILFTLQHLMSWLGVIWVIWEIVKFTTENKNKILFKLQFILFSVIFILGNGSFFALNYQQGFFFFQLGLVLHLFRELTQSHPSRKFILVVSLLVGISIPLGPLYSMKYGPIFCVIFILFAVLLFFYKEFKLLLMGSLIGVISSGVIIFLALGLDQLLEVGKMFLYIIENYPPRLSAPLLSDANEHYLWVPQLVIGILIICSVQLIVDFKESKNYRSFVQENTHIIILLFLSTLVLKAALDLSDKGHFREIASPSLLLLFAFTSRWLGKLTKFSIFIVQSYKFHTTIWVLVLVTMLAMNMHPKEAFRHVKPYWKYISADDDFLIAKRKYSYLDAVKEMRPEVKDMECFYTLNSEGVWYYYFKKPSCSRYHMLQWALSKEGSYEIINSLRNKRPRVILFSNYNSNRGLVTFHANSEVYDFVYQNYRPYKLVGNHWFWKGSSRGMVGAKLTELDIKNKIENFVYNNSGAVVFLNGILELKNIYNIDTLYVTSVGNNLPIAVATNDISMVQIKSGSLKIPWSIKIPMINISPKTKVFQLWGYSSSKHERIKIGQNFELDHTKVNKENFKLTDTKINM